MDSILMNLFWFTFFEIVLIIFSIFIFPIILYYVSFYWDNKYKSNYTRNETRDIVISFLVFFIIFILISRIDTNKKENSLSCYYWTLENYTYSESNWIFYNSDWIPFEDNSFMQYILIWKLKKINEKCYPKDYESDDIYNGKFY